MTALTHKPTPLTDLPPVTAWLSDMDGVLVKENRALPGANEFLAALRGKNIPFLVLTNNSVFTNRDLSARLANSGLDIPEENIWTSANATAAFLHQQSPGSTAYVIGEAGLTTAIHALPACGAIAAMITAATGQKPYFVGKPNPVMIRAGLNKIGAHSESAAMVGDRMDTDVRAGVEAGLRTHLVLSGSTAREDINNFPFRPFGIHEGIGDLIELVEAAH